MDNPIFLSAIVMGVICAFVGGSISSAKGRSYGVGFALGLILGIIGLIIVAVLPKNDDAIEESKLTDGTSKICPYCAEIIKNEAIICRYCRTDVSNALPQVIDCHKCGEKLELYEKERIARKFICCNCNELIDMN